MDFAYGRLRSLFIAVKRMASRSSACVIEPILLIHGGAGKITDERRAGKIKGCKLAVTKGYKILEEGGSVIDAVEAAIHVMEEDENFNAGIPRIILVWPYAKIVGRCGKK